MSRFHWLPQKLTIFVNFRFFDFVFRFFFIMPTVTTSKSYLEELGQVFVDECMKFVYHNSYDTKSYISVSNEIEDSIFEREWHIERDGDYQHGVGSFDPNEMWFIGESWWTQYEDLDTKEEQDVVKNYIKDVFPDTWRP